MNYTQNDLNIIKTQANGFVNDQLKWQRLRIESLEKQIIKKDDRIKNLEELLAYADKFNLINTQ